MAIVIKWSIPILLSFLFVLSVSGRSPGVYYPNQISDDYNTVRARSHANDNSLTPLSESELETLLYLLDKVERPSQVPVSQKGHFLDFNERRNKRTGHHNLMKKSNSIDWSNYFGIDKREIRPDSDSASSESLLLDNSNDKEGLLLDNSNDKEGLLLDNSNDKDESSNESSLVTEKSKKGEKKDEKAENVEISEEGEIKGKGGASIPDAKNDKEREEIMKEFYNNMAMAVNVKRRKRALRNINSTGVDKVLTKAGDNLIWDALKLTGSHRDEKMTKEEFKKFKKDLVKKISAAYDIEKLRHVLEGNLKSFGNPNKI